MANRSVHLCICTYKNVISRLSSHWVYRALICFWVRVSLCGLGYPGALYVDPAALELTENRLPWTPEYWDWRHEPPCLVDLCIPDELLMTNIKVIHKQFKRCYLMFFSCLITVVFSDDQGHNEGHPHGPFSALKLKTPLCNVSARWQLSKEALCLTSF